MSAPLSKPTGRKQKKEAKRQALTKAFLQFLDALGPEFLNAKEKQKTASRATNLWLDHLLVGEGVDIASLFSHAQKTQTQSEVFVLDIHVHLVCPHHLTIAFGKAHLAYVPTGRLAGFGALSRVVSACCSRFVLQEEATACIAESLVKHLGAKAAVAIVEATHPCHNVIEPRAHAALSVTCSTAGHAKEAKHLERSLKDRLNARQYIFQRYGTRSPQPS